MPRSNGQKKPEIKSTEVSVIQKCLHEVIEAQVKKTPDAIALSFENKALSYAELNTQANRCAAYLRQLGVGPDLVVGVLMERSIELVVALLGILKAGGAYLPLDPSHPTSRLQFILDDAEVSVVLTQQKFTHSLTDFVGTVRSMDNWQGLHQGSAAAVAAMNKTSDLAYVIYTSGSTGQPKGCMLPHAAICNRLQWMQSEYALTPQDRVLQKTPYTFDVSVWEFFWPLMYGAEIVLAAPNGQKDSHYLINLIQQKSITLCHFVPSMLRFFLNDPLVSQCQSLNKVFVSGEALPYELMQGFAEKLPHSQLHNLYGPTEAAVDVSYWSCEPRNDGIVPIGKAIDNIQLYILDEQFNPVAEGETGELYIAGIGLARGYLNRPELTAEKFLPNPFSTSSAGEKMYRTGDLALLLPDGNIEYLGRTDFQVKLRGLRVELGEIESVLRGYPGVSEAAVLVKGEEEGDPKLVAYLECAQNLNSKEVRRHCGISLPDYMLPNIVTTLTQLPVTAHGKLDRKLLPWPLSSSISVNSEAEKSTATSVSLSGIVDSISGYVCTILQIDSVGVEDDLFDLGATSLSLVRVVERIQADLKVAVPVDVFLDQPSVQGIAAYVAQNDSASVVKENTPSVNVSDLISGFVADILKCEAIAVDDDLFDRGATSLSLVRVVERIQTVLQVNVPVDVFLDAPSIRGISDYVSTQIKTLDQEKPITASAISHPNTITTKPLISLDKVSFQSEFYQASASHRSFSSAEIPLNSFSAWLALLQKQDREGKASYLYPSGGGFNPVRTYLSVKHGAIEGIAAGCYYYDPLEHALQRVGEAQFAAQHCHAFDREAADKAQFALYFIVSLQAIAPIYGEVSRSLAALESGYMAQLLQSRQGDYGLGICPLLSFDFDRIKDQFLLDSDERYVHGLFGGLSDNNQTNSPSYKLLEYIQQHSIGLCDHFQGSDNSVQLSHQQYDAAAQRQSLSQDLLDEFHSSHHQFRRFSENNPKQPLPKQAFQWDDYRLRACQRDYQAGPIQKTQLTRLLALVKPNIADATLYANICGETAIQLYVYVKPNQVMGIDAGVYHYDAQQHALEYKGHLNPEQMESAYTPFNRKHYKKSAFCVFMIARPHQQIEEDRALHMAYIESGYMGQLLMERQAEFSLGLCPIGALRFDKISQAFDLVDDKHILLQSFTCGGYQQSIPAERKCLERRRVTAKTGHKTEQDVAIIGVSGIYPGAANLEEFWENLKSAKCSIGAFPQSRKALFKNTRGVDKPNTFSESGYIENIDHFDSLLFKISPFEAKALDPQERLLLEQTWACLESAGYTASALNGDKNRVGVFIGAMWNDYQSQGIEHWCDSQREGNQPSPQEFSHHASLANRISYCFDFSGPSVAINTSCSSAMTALHYAYQSVVQGESNLAVIGGVNIASHPYHRELLQTLDLLSDDNTCRPLSAEANGWVLGEGVGTILIKPLSNAERDQDTILAVIKGSSIGHSGRAVRYSAPKSSRQSQAIKDALANAGLQPCDIDYVESAAPGASMADAAEMSAIKAVFSNDSARKQDCLVGTVKGNIGHLESASAMSQISKVLLQFKHRAWVPSLNCQPINPLLGLDNSQIALVEQYSPWQEHNTPQRALINVIGAAGSEAHVILESYCNNDLEAKTSADLDRELSLIPVSSATTEQLLQQINRLKQFVENNPQTDFSDLAFTLRVGRVAMAQRVVFIAHDLDGLLEQLSICLQKGLQKFQSVSFHSSMSQDHDSAEIHRLAEEWLSSDQNVDWSCLNKNHHQRIALPTYAFEKVSHWIGRKQEASVVKDIDEKIADEIVEEIAEETSSLEQSPVDITDPIIAHLSSLLATVTELPLSRIAKGRRFEDYGLNSLMIQKLNVTLELMFGNLSKTLMFEYRTIAELAGYFVTQHRETVINTLVTNNASHSPGKSNSAPSSLKKQNTVQAKKTQTTESDQIAIVGLSGRYPESATMHEFWQNLKSGRDCISEIPSERWDHGQYYDSEKGKPGKIYTKWGGFLTDVDHFDPLFFKISPREAEVMDPQERLFLETAWQTFEDAGYNQQELAKKCNKSVGVFVGVMYSEYQLYPSLEGGLGLSGSCGSIANRVSYVMDLHGPSMAVDTMCSSSLTAIQLACESIKRGECQYALAGGVNLSLHPNKFATQSVLSMSASDGRCKSFGDGGDGFVASEGVGAVLLKPLSQAIADGDQIYAVIKGSALNHGGRTNGYTVPDPNAHADLIQKALINANVTASMVSYVEAHGTGTALGDPIEISGLSKAYADRGSDSLCAIGSAKSNIGHCESAAGIAGISKILLQMKHGEIAPSLHSQSLNKNIDFETTPFRVQQELSEWQRPSISNECGEGGESVESLELPRIAAISSFGAGGANAHIIIEEYIADSVEIKPETVFDEPVMIVLSAKSEVVLARYAQDLQAYISENDVELRSLAYTLQVGRESFDERFACVVSNLDGLKQALAEYITDANPSLNSASSLNNKSSLNKTPANYCVGNIRLHQDSLAVLSADEDFEDTIKHWIKKSKYHKLLELWVKGQTIEWDYLYAESSGSLSPRRISLPTYPFDRKAYWVKSPSSTLLAQGQGQGQGQLNRVFSGFINPVLHRNTSTLQVQKFTSVFNGTEFFLADHHVNDQATLPSAVYFEMARSALAVSTSDADKTTNEHTLDLDNFIFIRPLVFSGDALELNLRILPQKNDRLALEFYSYVDAVEVLHAKGFASLALTLALEPTSAVSLENLKRQCTQSLDVECCYQNFDNIGINYGAAHRPIKQLWQGRTESTALVLAELELPKGVTSNGFGLHPSLLDGALQAPMGFLIASGNESQPSQPFALDAMHIRRSLPSTVWVLAKTKIKPANNSLIQKVDIDILTPAGELCVRLLGFSSKRSVNHIADFKKSSATSANKNSAEIAIAAGKSLYTPVWKTIDFPQSTPINEQQHWLVVGDIESLGGVEESRVSLNHIDLKKDIDKQLADISKIDKVLWISPLKVNAKLDAAELIEQKDSTLLGLFRLVQSLASLSQLKQITNFELSVITFNACALGEDENINPINAAVHGLCDVIAKEQKHWQVSVLDIDSGLECLSDGMLSLDTLPSGKAVVYRAGQFYQRQWLSTTTDSAAQTAFKPAGCYVIVGGAGNLGLQVSEYLIQRYQANIIWLGRRELDKTLQEKIDRIGNGEIKPRYYSVDTSDVNALQQVYQKIVKKFPQINGVIHSALNMQSGKIVESDADQFIAGLGAKIDAVVHVAEAFAESTLDFTLFFSSIQSIDADSAQSSYAAGCCFSDAYASALNQQQDSPVHVINWGYWQGTLTDNSGFNHWLRQSGLGIIQAPQGMEVIERALSGPYSHVAYPQAESSAALLKLAIDRQSQSIQLGHTHISLMAALKNQETVPLNFEPEKLHQDSQIFNHLITDLLWCQLSDLGLFDGESINPDDWAVHIKLPHALLPWLEESLRVLQEKSYLIKQNAHWRLAEAVPKSTAEAWRAWSDYKSLHETSEDVQAQIVLADAMLEALPKIVAGEIPATQIMFPNSSMHLVEGIYKNSPVVDFYNQVLAESLLTAIEAKLASNPTEQIRILEIGAGTGGTSKILFKQLAPYEDAIEEYCYTDISPAFLKHAETEYRSMAGYLRTELLNVESPPSEQGFDIGQYDFVVATNVLHATKNMRNTLRNTKSLLKNNGVLLVNEISLNNVFLHLTFGLLEGWWLSEDIPLRIPGSPALSADAWAHVLCLEGFRQPFYPAAHTHDCGQQIIVSESNGLVSGKTELSKAELSSAQHKPVDAGVDSVVAGRVEDRVEDRAAESVISTPSYTEAFNEEGLSVCDSVEDSVAACLSDILKLESDDIDPLRVFADYGIDSISGVEFVESLNQILGIKLSPSSIFEYPSIRLLAKMIQPEIGNARTLGQVPGVPRVEGVENIENCQTLDNSDQQLEHDKSVNNAHIQSDVALRSVLANSLADQLKLDEDQIDENLSFSDYGVDSIVGVRFVEDINRQLNIDLSPSCIFEYPSLEKLSEFIWANYRAELKLNTTVDTRLSAAEAQNKTDYSQARFRITEKPPRQSTVEPAHLQTPQTKGDLEPIAIIGMSGRFASANNVEELWQSISNGEELVEDVTRWSLDEMGIDTASPESKACRRGGLLADIASFDHEFFNIPHAEAIYMDPQQRLFLEESWKALEDSGYVGAAIENKKCGVYVGHNTSDYMHLFNDDAPANAMWGNAASVLSARISYYLNLQGPAVTVDSACSSSLMSIHLACQSLRLGETDMAIAGGVFIQSTPNFYTMANRAGMLSSSGHCYSFDQRADGFVPGEGVGAVILKPLSSAMADGDHIYAVVRGSGVNQDGTTNGITAPNAQSQERLINEVYQQAGIHADEIQLIEAHGTGTGLGDLIEFQALSRVFPQRAESTCALGAIKSNIGHTTAASGMAGIIKILQALKHKKIPPSINYKNSNPHINLANTPFYIPTQLQDWDVPQGETRCAAVSAFGMSGTNAHVVVGESQTENRPSPNHPGFLMTLSANSAEQLKTQVEDLLSHCAQGEIDCGNLSYTLLMGRRHFSYRLACVVTSVAELQELLREWLQQTRPKHVYTGSKQKRKSDTDKKLLAGRCLAACSDYIDSNPLSEHAAYCERLQTVAALFCEGYDMEFSRLFCGTKFNRISLPTYPFSKTRCWVTDDEPQSGARDMDTKTFESEVSQSYSSETYEYLFDELLKGDLSVHQALTNSAKKVVAE